MACYQFFLRKPDGSTNLRSAQVCADLSAAWGVIGDMARDAGEKASGSIFVKNDQGEVVILVGVASARVLTGQKAAAPKRWIA
jgi:hypothetical protein